MKSIYAKIGIIATPATVQIEENNSFSHKGAGFLAGLILGIGFEAKLTDTLAFFTEGRYTYVNTFRAYHYSKSSDKSFEKIGFNKLMLHGVGVTAGTRIYASAR